MNNCSFSYAFDARDFLLPALCNACAIRTDTSTETGCTDQQCSPYNSDPQGWMHQRIFSLTLAFLPLSCLR